MKAENENHQLSISKKKARELYPSATKEWKAVLEESLGKDFFSQNIFDRINSFQDILDEAGETLESFTARTKNLEVDVIGGEEIKLIALAFNEGKDRYECFYYPWFNMFKDNSRPSGFGLSYVSCDVSATPASVGSRFRFASVALAKAAFEKFPESFEKFHLG